MGLVQTLPVPVGQESPTFMEPEECVLSGFDATGRDASSRFEIIAHDLAARGLFAKEFNGIDSGSTLMAMFTSYTMNVLRRCSTGEQVCKSLGIPYTGDDRGFDFYKNTPG